MATQCLPQKEEKPRKQVWIKVDEELVNEPDLPSDLSHLLAEGTAPEQRNTPSLTARPSTSTKSPQCSLTPAGGAQLKVLAAASPT